MFGVLPSISDCFASILNGTFENEKQQLSNAGLRQPFASFSSGPEPAGGTALLKVSSPIFSNLHHMNEAMGGFREQQLTRLLRDTKGPGNMRGCVPVNPTSPQYGLCSRGLTFPV